MGEPTSENLSEPSIRAHRWLTEHGDVLYLYAVRRLGDASSAEDAVQETLLAAMRNLAEFRGEASERTWLIGILRHKVFDSLRRQSRDRAWVASVAEEAKSQFSDGFWKARPAIWPDLPEDGLRRRELMAAIQAALDELPTPMRTAFCLREIDEVDSKTICEVMNITPTNLWTLIHRSRLRLRASLSEFWEDRV